jgi:hypothetical protein
MAPPLTPELVPPDPVQLAPGIVSAVVTGAGCLLFHADTQTTALCLCEDHGICPIAMTRRAPCPN